MNTKKGLTMALGQLPQDPGAFLLRLAKTISKIPLAGLAIIGAGLFAWLGFWFLVRAAMLVYERFLSQKW